MSPARKPDLEACLGAVVPEPEPERPDELEAEREAIRAHARVILRINPDAPLELIRRGFAEDLWAFWEFFFPHYRERPDGSETPAAAFHRQLCADLQQLVRDGRPGEELATACPREHAKTVFATQVTTMWATASELRHFPLIFSDTFEQAADFLSDIRVEVETNERLQAIYPEYCEWAAEPNRRILSFGNGTWIMCAGSGKSVRGARRGPHRPDLIVLDDIENDEEVENPKRRRKKEKWYNRVVKKLGRRAVFVIVGTILHADSFLRRRISDERRILKAVVTPPAREDLWQSWEEVFHDRARRTPKVDARAFYEEHRREMDAGAEILWPGRFELYGLMVERAEDLASFLTERQNEPFDPAASWFPEDRIVFLEGDDVPPLDDVVLSVGFWDPSRGTSTSDTSTFVRLDVLKDGRRFVSEAVAERMPPEELIEVIVGWQKRRPFGVLGVERVGLSSYEEQLRKAGDAIGIKLKIEPVTPTGSKDLRIKSLRPLIVSAGLVYSEGLPVEAKQQLKYFPQHQNDDFPDAVHQANQLADEYSGGVKPAGATYEPSSEEQRYGIESLWGEPDVQLPRFGDRVGVIERAWA